MNFKTSVLLLASAVLAPCATYYVDSSAGNDAHAGTSPTAAWRSLDKVNATTFRPGDRVLLKSGGSWQGQLWPKGSGAPGKPITVDSYGGQALPVINGAGQVEDAVKLYNQEHWDIRNLEITNKGTQPAVRRGVHLILDNYGTARDVRVSRLFVHDVNGDLKRKDNGGIIWTIRGDRTPSRFDGLTVEDCRIRNVDRSGIVAQSYHYDRRRWFPSLRVVIRGNLLDEIGGDGITPWATDGVVVEYNVARRCNARSDTYNAGIWPWSCDNSVFRYNEAYLTRGTKDGQGFDSDYNSRNTLFEYNYSHDNEGGFMLICDDGAQHGKASIGNIGTVVRYNLSQDDAVRTFHLPGPVENTLVHNNAVHVRQGMDVNIVQMSNWGGWPVNTRFLDNVFAAEGKARYGHEVSRTEDGLFKTAPGMGPARGTVFAGNVYKGNHADWKTSEPRSNSGRKAGLAGSPLERFENQALRARTAEERHKAWMEFMRAQKARR